MECKFFLATARRKRVQGINRNIVECKFSSTRRLTSVLSSELIETLWNVNTPVRWEQIPEPCELIETLWNVNRADLKAEDFKDIELIETLWNVNKVEILELITKELGINRNIVECKYFVYGCSHGSCYLN